MTIRNSVLTFALALSPLALAAQTLPVEATPAAASAATPIRIGPLFWNSSFDGRKALAGEMYITFLVFKEEHGGTALWAEGQRATVDPTGRYAVHLGAASPERSSRRSVREWRGALAGGPDCRPA